MLNTQWHVKAPAQQIACQAVRYEHPFGAVQQVVPRPVVEKEKKERTAGLPLVQVTTQAGTARSDLCHNVPIYVNSAQAGPPDTRQR